MEQQRKMRIQNVLDEAVRCGEIAGCSALVLQDGQELFFGTSGWADRERAVPMDRKTIFRLFSMTKPVTAASAMILLERGQLDLLDPVEKFLPGFRNACYLTPSGPVRIPAPLLVKDLLGMTSGLVYGGNDGPAERRMQELWDEVQKAQEKGQELGTVDFANRMGQLPLAFVPGSRWQYGTSADVMGAVVEVASGMRFGDFLKGELFDPLGMEDTGFYLPAEKRGRLAQVYQPSENGLIPYTDAHLCLLPEYDHEPAFQSGGAGLLSTLEDYARFACMLQGEGQWEGVRILSGRTVRYMRQSQLTRAQKESMGWESLRGHGYGNFMRVLEDEGQAPTLGSRGEFGWDGWQGTYFSISPEDHLVLLFMMQKINTGTIDITRKFRSAVFAAL